MRAPRPPPSRTEGVGGAGPQGARRVTLKPREPGVSTFAQRRVQPGSTIDEAGILGVLWEAIHHGRTLYGRPCKDLRSFFDACDPEGHEAIVNDRLSDAMLRLGVGLTPQQVDTLISTIDVSDRASSRCHATTLIVRRSHVWRGAGGCYRHSGLRRTRKLDAEP